MPINLTKIAAYKDVNYIFIKLSSIYGRIPDTACQNKGECCLAGCPYMYVSEFLRIWSEIEKSKSIKMEIILKCVEMYLSNDLLKPCPLYINTDNKTNGKRKKGCMYYKQRPYNCRYYGVIPQSEYAERIEGFKKVFGEEVLEKHPLKIQCQCVKAAGKNKVKEGDIDAVTAKICRLDREMGVPTESIITKENTRTFHDFVMLLIFGESKMVDLTQFRLKASDEAKKGLVNEIRKQLEVS